MSSTAPPVPVETRGPVGAAVVAWRSGGATRLTVVAKTRLRIEPEQPLTDPQPAPPLLHEAYAGGNPTRCVAAPSDCAPFQHKAEVLVVGAAHAPGGVPAPRVTVRLGVSRGAGLLLDKTLDVLGDRATASDRPQPFTRLAIGWDRTYGGLGFADNPVGRGFKDGQANVIGPSLKQPAGFGPLSPLWGAHRHMLGGAPRPKLDAPLVELGEIHPGYFQSAPVDQQLDALAGDEWILLGNMHPRHPLLRFRLPSLACEARVRGAATAAIALRCDRVLVEPDELSCSLTFRGTVDLPGPHALAGLHVSVSLTPADASAPPRASAELAGTVMLPAGIGEPLGGTQMLAAWDAAPLGPPPAPPPPAHARGVDPRSTVGLGPDDEPGAPALPFRPGPAVAAAPPATTAKVAAQKIGGATVGVEDDFEPGAALPFGGAGKPASSRRGGVASTFGLDDDGHDQASSRPVVPFSSPVSRPASTPPSTPLPGAPWGPAAARAPVATGLRETVGLEDDEPLVAAAPPAAPEPERGEPARPAGPDGFYRAEQAVGPKEVAASAPPKPVKPARPSVKGAFYGSFKKKG